LIINTINFFLINIRFKIFVCHLKIVLDAIKTNILANNIAISLKI
jgi:hypothetical protein